MKKLWLTITIIIVLLALAAGGIYAILYRPAEEIYAAAIAASEKESYAEAKGILTFAAKQLSSNPMAQQRVAALHQRLNALLLAEADRAEAAGELAYAADLLNERDPERAQALRQTLSDREADEAQAKTLAEAYAKADIFEQAGLDKEALSAFRALNDYEDAARRAEAIETRLNFAAAKAVFTGTNFDEGIAALTALGTAEGKAAAEALQQEKEVWIEQCRQQYKLAAVDQLSAGAWHTAVAGVTPWIAGDERYATAPEEADKVFSGLTSVFYISKGRIVTCGETFGAEELLASLTDVKKVAPGLVHALILQENGHVTLVGSEALDRFPAEDWNGRPHRILPRWNGFGVGRSSAWR